jgi:ribA/ribD-fused uncharacterized protein
MKFAFIFAFLLLGCPKKPAEEVFFKNSENDAKVDISQIAAQYQQQTEQEYKKHMPTLTKGKWGEDAFKQHNLEQPVYFYGKYDAFGLFTNTQRGMPITVPTKFPDGRIEDVLYPSSEHYFQASKFQPGSPAWENIRSSTEFGKLPGIARNQQGPRTYDPANDHNTPKKNMWTAMVAKFKQHPQTIAALLSTGNRTIVENTSLLDPKVKNRENTWGAGDDGNGENRLGIFLMAMRRELNTNGEIPDEIPNYLLKDLTQIDPKSWAQ